MTHKQMSGEEMVDVLQAAGWREVERKDARPYDPDDYILVLMRLETKERLQGCFVRFRSAWTSDASAAPLQGLNHRDWRKVPDDLKWPAEIAEVMKFCS